MELLGGIVEAVVRGFKLVLQNFILVLEFDELGVVLNHFVFFQLLVELLCSYSILVFTRAQSFV